VSAGPLWTPTTEWLAGSTTLAFARAHGCSSFEDLYARSIADPAWFWDAVSDHLGLQWDTPYTAVLDESDGVPWARWFVGGRLNLAWNCVGRHVAGGNGEADAIRWEGEDGDTRTLTYHDLEERTGLFAAQLAALGVAPGDRVALVMPMTPEVVIAFYAIARLGAVIVPIFSGFSAAAIASRLVDCGVVCVVTTDGYPRRQKPIVIKATVDEAVAQAPGVRHVIVQRHLGAAVPWDEARDRWWHELPDAAPAPYLSVDSEHPLMVAYTSGTTGRPKGAVHVHGGFLVKIAQEVAFQADLKAGEALCWLTDMGWIMGPWETVGTHAVGGVLVLFDGAPDFPDAGRIWRLVERHRIAFLGVSPTLIRSLMGHGSEHAAATDLSSLRAFGGTGEPWNPAPYAWLQQEVGGGMRPIVNISGGTEIAACFVAADGCLVHRSCSLGRPSLGMAMDVLDNDGQPIREAVGELVCTRPWPGMTRGIWGDPERYLATYWARWPDVWVHGDWASIDEHGDWYLHGRSDDTLNIAGKRIGPAEFESVLVAHPDVVEACAAGVPHPVKGETVRLYVTLRPAVEPDEVLRTALRELVERGLGSSFRPESIQFVRTLPRTRSGKIVRRAVRAVVLGEDPGDLSTLEDATALDAIRAAV
jgi:acetyl-CoA synthetase